MSKNPVALYVEFRNTEGHTAQHIYFPETVSPVDGKVVPMGMLSRQISAETPKRPWRTRQTSEGTSVVLDGSGKIERKHNMADALGVAVSYFSPLAQFPLALLEAGWAVALHPVAVEMAQDDINEIQQGKNPLGLIRRMTRARTDAGFPEALFDTDTTLSVQPVPALPQAAAEIGDRIAKGMKAPAFEPLTQFSKGHTDLPALFASVGGSSVNSELYEFMAGHVTEAGQVKGRSNAFKAAAAAPVLGEGAASYPRPNGDLYYPRKWGDHEDVAVMRAARAANQFVLLYSPPGTGKTALCEGAFGEELITLIGSGDTEVSDLIGGYVTTVGASGDRSFVWEDGPLLIAAMEGKPFLIDEIGLIDPKVLSIVYGLMDGRREYTVTANPDRGTVKAAEGFYVVAATNPNAPGVRLSEALLSRFTIHAEMSTDHKLAVKLGVPQDVVTIAKNLEQKLKEGQVSWAPQMRELLAFRDVEKSFGAKFALANLMATAPEIDRAIVQTVVQQTVGEAVTPAKI